MSEIYSVLNHARDISGHPTLDVLEGRAHGIHLANSIREWLYTQPSHHLLPIDFCGIRAVTASLCMELGPVFMQTVARIPALEHRYPIYSLFSVEHAYTFALAFQAMNWTGLALVNEPVERSAMITPLAELKGTSVIVLGVLSSQMEQILRLADDFALKSTAMTANHLSTLEFQRTVTHSARGQRLTELYLRRLLSFVEDPHKPRGRLFTPAWRLSQPARCNMRGKDSPSSAQKA